MASNHYFPEQFFFTDDLVSVNHTFNFQMLLKTHEKALHGALYKSEPTKLYVNGTKNHTSPERKRKEETRVFPLWKTAHLHLPAQIQTLARKVRVAFSKCSSCRERNQNNPTLLDQEHVPEMFHGLAEVKVQDSEEEGRNALACLCGSVCDPGRACVDVFVCGMAGLGKQSVGRALGSPSRQTRQLGCRCWAGWMAAGRETCSVAERVSTPGEETLQPPLLPTCGAQLQESPMLSPS